MPKLSVMKSFLFICVSLLSLTACKMESIQRANVSTPLRVSLSEQYSSDKEVDTAVAYWINGSHVRKFSMQREGDTLTATSSHLKSGDGHLIVQLLSQDQIVGSFETRYIAP